MINFIGFGVSLVALIAFIFVVRFIKREAKDERGYQIIGKAGIVVFVAFLVGHQIIFILNALIQLNGQQYTLALTCLFSLVIISYSATIMVLKRKY